MLKRLSENLRSFWGFFLDTLVQYNSRISRSGVIANLKICTIAENAHFSDFKIYSFISLLFIVFSQKSYLLKQIIVHKFNERENYKSFT